MYVIPIKKTRQWKMEKDLSLDCGKFFKSVEGRVWVARKFEEKSILVEYKLSRNKFRTLAFSKLEDHQVLAGEMSESSDGVYHKISDMSASAKPSDAFIVRCGVGLLVVGFAGGECEGEVYGVEFGELDRMLTSGGYYEGKRGSLRF
jgi:hypothetical protein